METTAAKIEYVRGLPLDQQRQKVQAIIDVLQDIQDDVVQDIAALWKGVSEPSSDYCLVVLQAIYHLLDEFRGQDNEHWKTVFNEINSRLSQIHNQELADNKQNNENLDDLLSNM